MKRNVITCAGLAVIGLALALACQGSAQGPPASGIPGFGGGPAGMNQTYLPTSPPLTARGGPGQRLVVPEEWQQPQQDPDLNRDLLVTPAAGPWLIYVHSYDDANGPSLADFYGAENCPSLTALDSPLLQEYVEIVLREDQLELVLGGVKRAAEVIALAEEHGVHPEALAAFQKLQSPEMVELYRKEAAGNPKVDPNYPHPNVLLGIGLAAFELGDYKVAQENLSLLKADGGATVNACATTPAMLLMMPSGPTRRMAPSRK